MVHQTSATKRWPLASLDISTAFLQGFKFSDLPEGIDRQPCAFVPPPDVIPLLATLSPERAQCMPDASSYVFELQKSAYGLKDAPLMWYIAISAHLKYLKTTASCHDACVYKRFDNSSKTLDLLLSLHVDDTLITGEEQELDKFARELERKFGNISYQKGSFTHFGLDTVKNPDTHTTLLSASATI